MGSQGMTTSVMKLCLGLLNRKASKWSEKVEPSLEQLQSQLLDKNADAARRLRILRLLYEVNFPDMAQTLDHLTGETTVSKAFLDEEPEEIGAIAQRMLNIVRDFYRQQSTSTSPTDQSVLK